MNPVTVHTASSTCDFTARDPDRYWVACALVTARRCSVDVSIRPGDRHDPAQQR